MSTKYYVCRKQELVRAEAIADFLESVRKSLRGYLEAQKPTTLDDEDFVDALQEAVVPMCSALENHIGYDPLVHLCTISQSRITWHKEELYEAGFEETDDMMVSDEYGKTQPLGAFLNKVTADPDAK